MGTSGGPGPVVMPSDALTGDAVVNERGESLGTLAHLMIDVRSGRIAYAVLARGGVLGLGERLHAIPWSAFTFDANRREFILDVEVAEIEGAPGFDRLHWPSMADPAFTRSVERFLERRTR